MTFQGEGRIGGNLRCPLVGRYVPKLGQGRPTPGRWRSLANDDAALVQQFAGFGEHGEEVAAQSDLVDDYVGFRLYERVLRENDVLVDFGTELVLLVLGVQVLL